MLLDETVQGCKHEDERLIETLSRDEQKTRDVYLRQQWTELYPGIDYPREMDWMEIRRMFGGALMAVGMD
jgi:hypothetical protein